MKHAESVLFTFNKSLHEALLTNFIDTCFAGALFHLDLAI